MELVRIAVASERSAKIDAVRQAIDSNYPGNQIRREEALEYRRQLIEDGRST